MEEDKTSLPGTTLSATTAFDSSVKLSLHPEGSLIADRYEIISVLGSGGNAVVYRCMDRELRREVALKLLIRSGPAMEARIRREAAVGSTMEHPHLLRLYEFGTHEGTPFITMPVAEGGTLSQKLVVTGPLPFPETYSLCCKILEGLKFLHNHGFVHRDIKPSNIFFDDRGTVRLGDFGIVWREKETRYTVEGHTPGTPQYMPPEFLTGQTISFASDLWSLGLTVKEMLGIRAFESARPDVPKWFLKWLSGLVEVEPSRRFRHAGSALSALRKHRAPPVIIRKRWITALLISAAMLMSTAAWIMSGKLEFMSGSAEFIRAEGDTITGYSGNGTPAWSVSFPAKVATAVDLDKSPGASSRFLVVYGGRETPVSPGRMPPRAAILTRQGKTISEIDLLGSFNPFHGSFDERFFVAELFKVEDSDGDGHPEAFINCKHNMYPDILYFISSSDGSLIGALANTGHLYSIASEPCVNDLTRSRFSFVIGINNMMGYQDVVIPLGSIKGFRVSPDMDEYGEARHQFLYRPIGAVNGRTFHNVEVKTGDILVLTSNIGERIFVDRDGRLGEGDPSNLSVGSRENEDFLETFYLNIRRVRKLILSGRPEEGMQWTKDVVKDAGCTHLALAAQYCFSDAFLQIGDTAKSLDVLPGNVESCANPGAVFLRKAKLLNLLGRYREALESAVRTRNVVGMNNWYGLPDAATAEIMEGSDHIRLWKMIDQYYNQFMTTPSSNAWLLQTGIIRGESGKALEMVRGMTKSSENRTALYDRVVLFPAMGEIWTPFAMVDAGMKGAVMPERVLVEETKDEERIREYRLLEAFREYRMGDKKKSVAGLKASFEELGKAAERESSALVPYVISSYYFGFASAESGNAEEAAASLREALRLYPHGALAEKARSILKRLKR